MRHVSVLLDGSSTPVVPPGEATRIALDILGHAERLIEADPMRARAFIGQAQRLLEPISYLSLPPTTPPAPGLVPWQERKVIRHIDEHLALPIRNRDLAGIVGLSTNHFSRRFKSSFGLSPRDYLIRTRVERSKALMVRMTGPLSQIALDCGFCDQSHMSRTFHQVVGCTPRRWRLENASGLASEARS